MVLRARWPKITVTPVDISIKTTMTAAMVREIGRTNRPAAQYIAKYSNQMFGEEFMWDELAALAWLDPTIITKTESLYMDIVVDRGAAYGDTLTWRPGTQPGLGEQLVTVQADLDRDRFYRMAVDLFTRPTPNAR
jgi:inosine-uridine nucleoside N-ribohydrolase